MKKIYLLIIITSFCFITTAKAQENKSIVNLSVGIGSNFLNTGLKTKILPIEGSYEYFLLNRLSIGGFLGIVSTQGSDVKYKHTNIGGLVKFYFIKDGTYNLYAGGRLGYHNFKVVNKQLKKGTSGNYSYSPLAYSISVGGRYWITNFLAAHAELGYGISLLNIGLTIGF